MTSIPIIGIGIPFGRRGGGIDANAAAFIAAAGITDPTQKAAINRLVLNYKGIGDINTSVDLWSITNAIYPIVGGSATQHKFNLKNPLDTDAAFRLAFSGGWTHSANGMLGNGTNTFANTFLNALNNFSSENFRAGIYITTNVNESKFDIGVSSGANELMISARLSNLLHINMGSTSSYGVFSNTDSRGNYSLIRRDSTNSLGFKNGAILITHAETEVRPNFNIYIGALNAAGTASVFASKNYAFSVFGQGLSNANALIEYNIIQAFQTDLGRAV
jgi:hypothetical protein